MLVAARLRHIASTKWGKRRYLVMETLELHREIVGTVRSTETGAGQISTGSRRRLRGRHKNALLVALPAEYVEQAEECHAGR